jgi:hypothetical protein
MGALRHGLVGSSPAGPCDDVSGLDTVLGEPVGDTADFLDRPADQRRSILVHLLFGGVASFARCRSAAIMAKASMTSDT